MIGRSEGQTTPGGGAATSRIAAGSKLKGDLEGGDGLLVEGTVDGTVSLAEGTVTVASGGKISGDVRARRIVVEGRIEGDVAAVQDLVVSTSGSIQGTIRTPRLALHEGGRLEGTIDMGEKADARAREKGASPARSGAEGKGEEKAAQPPAATSRQPATA